MNAVEFFKKASNRYGKLYQVMQVNSGNGCYSEINEGFFRSKKEAIHSADHSNRTLFESDKETCIYEVRAYTEDCIDNVGDEVDTISDIIFSAWN